MRSWPVNPYLRPRGCGIALASVGEFWSVVTHPAIRSATAAKDAARFLRDLEQQAGITTWVPEFGFSERLAKLAVQLGARGPAIFDLQIGLTAYESGAEEIWTHDPQFIAPPGLQIVDPLNDG